MARHSPLEVSITTVLADRWRLGLGCVWDGEGGRGGRGLESLHLKMVDTDVSLFFFILNLNNYVQLSTVPSKNRYTG